jgi:hypothetical protein
VFFEKETIMPNIASHSPRRQIFRRFWKPAVVTGAGGTAVAVWFEEIMMFGQEILALIFLPILAGTIYLLDIFIFESRMPRRKDLENTYEKSSRK